MRGMELSDFKHSSRVPEKIGEILFRDYQHVNTNCAVDYCADQWANFRKGIPVENGVMSMSVGSGKTMVIGGICYYVSKMNGKVAVLTRTAELVKQDSDQMWDMDVPETRNSVFCSSIRNSRGTSYNVVVGSEGTVAGKSKKKGHVTYTLVDRFSSKKCNATVDGHAIEHKDGFVPDVAIVDETHQVDWKDCMDCQKAMEEGFDIYKNKDEDGNTRFSQYAVIFAHWKRIKPHMVIIGMTGTPFRGSESIIGPFWKNLIGFDVNMHYLVERGYLTRNIFGETENAYDYSEFDGAKHEGNEDFSSSDLKKMGKKASQSKTDEIMTEVIRATENRLGVLITCASKRHCEKASVKVEEHYCQKLKERILKEKPGAVLNNMDGDALRDLADSLGVDRSGDWAIITESTKNRGELLDKAKTGEIKYTFQIGCLTTGVDVPYWDTSVLLRRIGSLNLLTQLLGRGMRLLKPFHIAQGLEKPNHLILDFSETLVNMHQQFDDPILEEAVYQASTSKKKKGETQRCPACGFENAKSARRCINRDATGERCEHFFCKPKECPNKACKAPNDPCAAICRKCDMELIDPDEKLYNKHYKEGDFIPVSDLKFGVAKNGALWVRVYYDKFDSDGKQLVASLFYGHFSMDKKNWAYKGMLGKFYNEFILRYVADKNAKRDMYKAKTADDVVSLSKYVKKPAFATYKKSPKTGKDIVDRVKF